MQSSTRRRRRSKWLHPLSRCRFTQRIITSITTKNHRVQRKRNHTMMDWNCSVGKLTSQINRWRNHTKSSTHYSVGRRLRRVEWRTWTCTSICPRDRWFQMGRPMRWRWTESLSTLSRRPSRALRTKAWWRDTPTTRRQFLPQIRFPTCPCRRLTWPTSFPSPWRRKTSAMTGCWSECNGKHFIVTIMRTN